jgi:solute carrier family 25 folate transporter 32
MHPRGPAGRYTGVLQACRTIARDEGVRGFYKGMAVNLVRTVPSSALTILTYELIMQHLAQRDSARPAS